MKRMRQKVLQFHEKFEESNKEIYRIKSKICTQSVDELNKLEEVPMLMIKNIDFRNVHSKFQKKIKT